MSKRIFEPVISTFLVTDQLNHDPNVEFKISYGFELENPNPIFKVQVVGDGFIKGRQAPSYSDSDFDKIINIRSILKEEFDSMDRRLRDQTISINDLSNDSSQF